MSRINLYSMFFYLASLRRLQKHNCIVGLGFNDLSPGKYYAYKQ